MRRRRITIAGPGAICAIALALTGCNAPMIPLPPRDAREALHRINDNAAKIETALYCKPARVSFRFRDEGGQDRRFIGQPAALIFDRPRCLYFDIKSPLAGSVARIASNDERYWIWIDVPDQRKLWWGSWEALEQGRAREMAIPPDHLLDALMFREIPEQLDDGAPPMLVEDGDTKHLLYPVADAYGWPYVRRELILDANSAWMPREIIDRLEDGRVAMHARLRNYRRVSGAGPAGPITPRNYVVNWELSGAEMRLDLTDVRYRSKQTPFCDFPDGWDAEVEALDLPEMEGAAE